jgi:hypothetical protein
MPNIVWHLDNLATNRNQRSIITMKAIAVRTGQQRQKGPLNFHDIASVTCGKCDAGYIIKHKRKLKTSLTIAAKQGIELKTILTEDHGTKVKREHPDIVEFE